MMLQLGGLAPRALWEGTAWDVSGPPLRDMAPCETAELGAQSAQVTGVGSKPAPEPDSLGPAPWPRAGLCPPHAGLRRLSDGPGRCGLGAHCRGGSVCTGSPGRSRRSPLPPVGEAPKRRDPRGSLPPSPRPPSPSPRPPSPSPPSRRPPQEADPVQLNGGAPPWTPVLLLGERRAALHGRSGRLGGAAGTALHVALRPLPPVPVGGTRRRLAESCAKGCLRRGPWARPPEPACHRHAEQCHGTGSRRQRREEPGPAVPAAGTGPGPPWGRGAAWGSAGADAPCRRASGPAAATVTGHRAARGRGSRVEPAGEPGFRTPTQLRSLRRPRDPGCPGTRAVRLSRKGGQGGLLLRGGREGSVVSPDSRELAGCRTLLGTQPRYPKG